MNIHTGTKGTIKPRISQRDLDRLIGLVGGARQVADIYPLSALQQGMLFHCQYEPQSTVYLTSQSCRLNGALDAEAFARAWQVVVERHAVLRTAFVGQDLDVPLQVVLRGRTMPFETHDWSDLPSAEQEARFLALRQAERERGFDLAAPPLMRLVLIRLAPERHWLMWTAHHLLLDGWSVQNVLGEVFAAYAALVQGAAPRLARVRPYRDYIAWLQRQDLAAAETYWRERLAGLEGPTPLGITRVRGETAALDRHAEHMLALPAGAGARLEGWARQHKLTMSTLVQGAWALLLARYGGMQDVVFGVTVSGRPAELTDVERMVGLFINTLPLRVTVAPEQATVDWLQQVHARVSELIDYQYTPLPEVQRWSGLSAATPLFDSIVVFENYPSAAADTSLRVEDVGSVERTNYPLTVAFLSGRSPALKLIYDTSRFEAEAIERLAGHFVRLLEALVCDPARRVSELSLLGAAEREQLVVGWNDTAVAYPADRCLHELFAAQAARDAAAPAVIYRDQTLSYGELEQRANQLAHYLRRRGVGPDTVVGLCVERSPALVIGVLGILKAGGAYLPLDPSYPAERLGYMLGDAGAAVLVTQAALTERLLAHAVQGMQVVRLDADAAAIAEHPVTAPHSGVDPDNLAYVIYTSGSTGRPKGVGTIHRNVTRLIKAANYVELTPKDVFLHLAPLAFDASTFEIWGALLNGAKLVVYPDDLIDIGRLRQVIAEADVSVLWLTAGLFHQVIDEDVGALAPVRQLLAGGDVLSPPHVRRVLESLPGCRVINGYGPTEGTTFSTTFRVPDASFDGSVPIGGPISNTQVYVLDGSLDLVPTGAAGELYIGGDGLARGYLGRAGLTAERFVPSPFASGERLYRTGDLVRWRADGNLEFLGRIDDQVKLRGFRIEPGEIETALTAHAGVAQAAVVVRAESGSKRLVAYVVPTEGTVPDVGDVRSHLKQTLPDYMVPQAFVTLTSLPLTANGKLDRKALPAPDGPASADYVAPRNDIEATLANLFAEVLGHQRVGIHDNFFELGGDSIRAMQLINLVRTAFDLSLAVRTVFESPTVAELATRTEEELVRDIDDMTPEQIEAELQNSIQPNQQTESETENEEGQLVHG